MWMRKRTDSAAWATIHISIKNDILWDHHIGLMHVPACVYNKMRCSGERKGTYIIK